jgi:hypothetical protein
MVLVRIRINRESIKPYLVLPARTQHRPARGRNWRDRVSLPTRAPLQRTIRLSRKCLKDWRSMKL